ncbi:SMR family transporter [Tsuneonella suprasediminis]|uniref:SMR family transporter n=1 Tax=Tsuneonella suprasediminis TaxID=2306996 RepID=UPI002F93CBB9
MSYVYLGMAILTEVIGTTFLKQSDGFSKLVPGLVTVAAYLVSFYFLSLTLKSIPTGIAYAIWSGAGIVLISAVAWIFHGQKLDGPAIAGMALIICGVVIMNLFSRVAAH